MRGVLLPLLLALSMTACTAPSYAAPTIRLFNGWSRDVEAVWRQLTPQPGAAKRVRLVPEENFDTGIAVGGGEVYSIAFQRRGVDVAPPVVGTGFEIAMLLEPRGHRAYIALRPVYDERIWADVGDAMNLSGEAPPSSLYCISGDVQQWNGKRVIVFANGLLMELTGAEGAEGRRCFCGRAIGRQGEPGGLDRFEAGSGCGRGSQ